MTFFKNSGRWVFIIPFILLIVGLWIFNWHLKNQMEEPSLSPIAEDLTIDTAMSSSNDSSGAASPPLLAGGPSPEPDRAEPELRIAEAEERSAHPSDPLLSASKLIREQWSEADALGNRDRTAIYHTDEFKYPLLRVEESWSGKTNELVHRHVMVADHLLVAPHTGVDAGEFGQRISAQGFTMSAPVGETAMLVSFDARADDPAELPRRIIALGEIAEYAEPDYLVWPCLEPNDPAYTGNKLWGLHNPGGVSGYTAGADIDAPAGWAVRNEAPSIIVAVTDTGIRYDHEDLAANMWRNPGETPGNGIDDDGNGVIDDVFGYNAYDNNGDPMDTQGHGTHCAGTIGARGNNSLGLTGVAWDVQLMAVKFLGPNGGTTSDAIKVIDYSRQNGAHIINASWGGGGFSHALRNAIAACANAGIPFVAAAGNTGTNNDARPHYPSSYNLPNVVAVAATNANDQLTEFSCFGQNSVNIAAPGWQIWSTYSNSISDYRFLQGTSMAAPHVSGALALALAHYPYAGVEELIEALYQSADKLPSLEGKVSSGGRLNLHRLLTEISPPTPHDQFDTPFVLEGNFSTWSGSNRTATREPDEDTYSPASGSRTLWFAWQAPYDGFTTVSASSLGAGQRVVVFKGETRDTLMVVYDSGESSTATAETRCSFQAEAGAHYRIVTASNSTEGELFNLSLEHVAANDLLSGAFILEGQEFEITGSNRGATAQPFETTAPHAGVGAGHSVWYRWDAPVSGSFSLNTEGSDTDTVLAVYTGDPLHPEDFTTIGANDDVSGMLRWSRVDFDAVQGERYFIAIDTAMGGLPGPFILRGASPLPPVIATQPRALKVPLGGRAVFSVGADGTRPLRYQWFRGNEALPGAWEQTLIIDPVTEDSLGAYHVVVSNSFGSTVSHAVPLSERLIAPDIIFRSGDVSTATGLSVELRVEARGSQPMTYVWRHNGELVSGANGPTLALSSVADTDAGTYTCRVVNGAGEASATMRLTVAASPFSSWQWRMEEMPGPGVSDMVVIANKVYALAGDRILVSEDGLEWSPWMLPSGFHAVSLSRLHRTWICVGMDDSGNGRTVTSTNGVDWSIPQPLTGLPGTNPQQHVTNIVELNRRLIGQRANATTVFGPVFTSTNGIDWTPATLDGATTPVNANGPFAVDSNTIIVGSSASTNPPRVFRSEDGVDWSAIDLPPGESIPMSTRGATRWNGKFLLFSRSAGNKFGWISEDGINWTLQTGNSWPGGIDFNGDFVSLGGTQFDGLSVAWGTDPWTTTETFIKPATGDIITAYRAFNGRVIYGTERGFLGSLTEPTDLQPFGGRVTVPSQIVFQDNRFFVVSNVAHGTRSLSPMVSGDGTNWRKMRPWTWANRFGAEPENTVAAYPLAGFGGGHFWGRHNSDNGPAKGLLPHAMPETPTANGLPNSVTSLKEIDGTMLAIADSKLYRSTNGGDSWDEAVDAPVILHNWIKPAASLTRSGSRWLLTNGATNSTYEYGFVHHSDDGVNWTKTTGKAGYIVPFDGGLYGLENLSSWPGNVRGWKSANNGTSWEEVPLDATNRLANVEVLRLGYFADNLVALVQDSSYFKSLWFSSDGISWFPATTPGGIVDFATGLDQFVAYTNTGAIIQAGSPTAGGAAPVVRATYPVHESAAVIGSWLDITGEAFDPEGEPITLECHVDGQLLGTAGAGEFHFRFRVENPKGHTIILRATDPSGLVGSDELRVVAVSPQAGNLLDSGAGTEYLPKVALIEFNGAYYAAGDTGLIRSTDGVNWQPVLLPSLSSKLKGMAAGNGSLVIQTERGELYTTRDGINWVQVGSTAGSSYLVSQPVIFSGGRFLVIQDVAGQIGTNYRTSVDGINWTNAGVSTRAMQAMIGDNGVMVSIHDIGSGINRPVWSADGGNNWNVIPDIEPLTGQNHALAMAQADGVFLIAAADGRAWRSTDGRAWSMSNLPAPLPSEVRVSHAGGRFFVGSTEQYLYSTTTTMDGSWKTLSPPVRTGTVIQALGRYIAQGDDGMAWSQNGISWQSAQGGPVLPIDMRLASNGQRLLVIDENGAAWSSNNGVVWRQDFAGSAGFDGASLQVGRQMATLGSRILLAGTHGMLLSSADDGASWSPSKADGQAVPNTWPDIWHFNRLQVAADTALATAAIQFTEDQVVLRSVDGVDWQSVPALADHRIVDVAGDGTGTWLAVGSDAAIFRSNDHGQSWQSVANPGIATARAVVWFNNQWLIFGAATSGAASRCWGSQDGITWTDLGANGLQNSDNDYFHIEGHGQLVVWNRANRPVISSDGINWQTFNGYSTFVSNSLYWVAPTDTGFLLATPGQSSQMFVGTPDGQSWQEIPRLQRGTEWAATHDGRLFLFANGSVVEWTERDLELELSPLTIATMGVGDDVQSPAVLRNPGGVPFSGEVDVDGWLSADGFFGDGNDVYIGRIQLSVPLIQPDEETMVNLSFKLPNNIRPGDSRLVVVLDPDHKLLEINRVNNISISAGPAVRVPQRKLEVLANGDGTVSADQNAEYHPHGARIAMVATPGKGARFTGWGGDAVGSLGETLVIMDSDKSVEANFISTSALTLFTRGGGTVQQSLDDGIYVAGSTAELTATPLPGWTFSGWTGALTGAESSESILMDSNKVVTARFSLDLDAWRNLHFTAAELEDASISGPDADPDGNGLENWREWLRGSDPKNPNSRGQGEMRREGDWIVMTYTRLETMPPGHSVRASGSFDLDDWTPPLNERVLDSIDGVETIEARLNVSQAPKAFMRIGDTRPQP